jgi:predicted dehydrogenase
MGAVHARAIARHPAARLAAVFDPDRERAARLARGRHRVRVAESPADLLADPAIDALLSATPHDLHAPQSLAALAAGKHVLVEKPMALSRRDAASMVDAARRADRRLLVGQVMRFWPNVARARAAIAAGRIGDVRHVIRRRMTHLPDAGRAWAYDAQKAGNWAVHGNACHEIDAVLFLTGAAVRELQVCAATNNPRWNAPDELSMLLTLDNGAICNLSQSLNCPHDGVDTILIGTRGAITLSDLGRGFRLDGASETLSATDGFGEQIDDLVAAVRRGSPSRIDGENVLETMRVLDDLAERIRASDSRLGAGGGGPETPADKRGPARAVKTQAAPPELVAVGDAE